MMMLLRREGIDQAKIDVSGACRVLAWHVVPVVDATRGGCIWAAIPPGGSSSSPFSSRYLAASVISFILASASIYFACIEVKWSGVE